MARVSYYLDKDYKNSNGSCPLLLILRHQGRKRRFPLNIRIRPEDWDVKSRRMQPGSFNAKNINARLYRSISDLEIKLNILEIDRLSKYISIAEYENVIKQHLYGASRDVITLSARMQDYANRARRPGTKGLFIETLTRLRNFHPEFDRLPIDEIDREFLIRFEQNELNRGNKINTISIHLRNIRTVFNDAIDSDLTTNYPFKRFKIKTEKTRKRCLTVEQLRTLFDYPGEEFTRQYVDMFKLIFFFCGINIVDLYNLHKIENGRVTFLRRKTDRPYDLKVEPEAMAIIERYQGKDSVVNIKDRYKDHRDYTHHINYALKKVGPGLYGKRKKKLDRQPLFPDISSYWARHTWATIAAELDIPDKIISLALGHAEEQTVTDIYILRNRKKVDEANRKVIDWVLYGIRDGRQVVNPWDPEFYGDYAALMNSGQSTIG